jgi:hypothetical protein
MKECSFARIHYSYTNSLINKLCFKLIRAGTTNYHLGGNFFQFSDGSLAWGAHLYVPKILNNYETMFGSKPKEFALHLLRRIILRLIPLFYLMPLVLSIFNQSFELFNGNSL